jgi:hypothetical protein
VDAGEEVTAGTGTPVSRRWLRAALLCGLAYFVIGIVTAELSRTAGSGQMRQVWRLAAWLLSAIVFATHIWYERIRLGGAAAGTALRAASAVALGGFLLAAAATVHALNTGSGHLVGHVIALVAWPVLLAVPAFLVAWAAAAVLARKKSG